MTNTTETTIPFRRLTHEELEAISRSDDAQADVEVREYFRRRFLDQKKNGKSEATQVPQYECDEELKQRLERYNRFAQKRDSEIIREMHGLPPKDPVLSTANHPSSNGK